jgi:hypothetical protein
MPGVSVTSTAMGVTPEAHVELGLDSSAYAGTNPAAPYGQSAPFSATIQAGVNPGIGYSFY